MLFKVDDRTIYRSPGRWWSNTAPGCSTRPSSSSSISRLGGVYPFKTNGINYPYNGLPAATVKRIRKGEITMEVDWVRVHEPIEATRE